MAFHWFQRWSNMRQSRICFHVNLKSSVPRNCSGARTEFYHTLDFLTNSTEFLRCSTSAIQLSVPSRSEASLEKSNSYPKYRT